MSKGIDKLNFTRILLILLLLFAVGCGKPAKDGDAAEAGQTANEEAGKDIAVAQTQDWTYVPETVPLELEQTDYYIFCKMKQVGDDLYYPINCYDPETEICAYKISKYSVASGKTEELPMTFDGMLDAFDIGEDGSVWAVVTYWGNETEEHGYRMEKYDISGEKIFSANIDEWVGENSAYGSGYPNSMSICEDELWLACERKILLFDVGGNFSGSIDPLDGQADGRICALGRGKDGKAYACVADANMKCSLAEIDFAQKKASVAIEAFPYVNANCMSPGMEWDLMVSDSTAVYEYDMSRKERKQLFAWADIGMMGNKIISIGAVSGQKIMAVEYDWSSNQGSLQLLSRTAADQTQQKEELVLATMSGVTVLQNAVAEFNKKSEKYYITIQKYANDLNLNNFEEQQQEAMTKLNMELAAGKGPDIIDSTFLATGVLARQGFLVDLNPYLENSTVISREDFVGNTLEACTVDGKLCSLPKQFTLYTLVGRASDVGAAAGWTVEEFMAAVEAHPGVQVRYYPGKISLMWLCIQNCFDYVDRETGKCRFDSPEFIRLLEFADRYGDVTAPDSDMAYQEQIQKGEILLLESYVDEFEKIQIYNEIFEGEPCVIGYPTLDGSPSHRLDLNEMCAISANSGHKEGAWEFLESYVTAQETENLYAFPAIKERLEKQMQEEMAREYDKTVVYGGAGGWSTTFHPPTQEEVDQVLELIRIAKPKSSEDKEISVIISEEVADFFEGNKTAAEVAGVIQRRAQLYLDENR